MSPRHAILTMIVCFLIGAFGISVLSGILHKYIPHSVVDCDDKHGDEEHTKHGEGHGHSHGPMFEQQSGVPQAQAHHDHFPFGASSETSHANVSRRPSLHQSISSKVAKLVTRAEKPCHENDNGECYGDLCEIRPARLQSRKSLASLSASRSSGAIRNQNSLGPHDRPSHPRKLPRQPTAQKQPHKRNAKEQPPFLDILRSIARFPRPRPPRQ